jgi:hypothetical protein
VLLACFDPGQQEYWLERAHREIRSVADLRLELRSSRNGDEKASSGREADEEDDNSEALVCPIAVTRQMPAGFTGLQLRQGSGGRSTLRARIEPGS